MLPHFSSVLDQNLLILADNDNIHKSLDESEIRLDPTTNHRVSCSSASKNRCCHFFSVAVYLIHFKFVGFENVINRMSSNFDQILPLSMELSALERLNITPLDIYCRKRCFTFFLAVFNLILSDVAKSASIGTITRQSNSRIRTIIRVLLTVVSWLPEPLV